MLDAWGDVWEFRGSLWFVSLSINHTLISFVVCELNARQQPVAVFPLFITVWELCCAGGSPCSAPGRSRGHQLVHYGLRWGTDTGRRVGVWISVWVNICSAGGLSSGIESKIILSPLCILIGFNCCKTILISPPGHLGCCLTDFSVRLMLKTYLYCLQEVTSLVQDAVDKRVKQYTESLKRRRQPKQMKELAPASALFVKGNQNVAKYI